MIPKQWCWLLLCMCSFLTACVPESERPLSDPTTAQQDARLHGLWSVRLENGDIQYVHIGVEPERPLDASRETPEAGLMRFWLIGHNALNKQVGNPFGMRFFVTPVDDRMYANLVLAKDEHKTAKPTVYWFLRYDVSGNELSVWGMDFEATAKVVEDKRLAGRVVRDGKELKEVTITDTTENVLRFLRSGGDEIVFPDSRKTVYRRVG